MRHEDPTVLALAEAAIRLSHADDRERAIDELIERAGDRRCLEKVRDEFTRRLHRCSFDFDATRGLKLVIAALARAPWTASPEAA